MSQWRRLALELFPEHRKMISDRRQIFSINALFFELLPLTREAHIRQDQDKLARVYRFAEWCWKQKKCAPDLYNAVCVTFYEHLADEEATLSSMPDWISLEIFDDIKTLFKARMASEFFRELENTYRRKTTLQSG